MNDVQDITAFARLLRAFSVDMADLEDEGWPDPARGNVTWRTLICADRNPSAGMVAGVAVFAPGGTLNAHCHGPHEVYFGLAGAGVVSIDGVPFPIAPGVALFVPGGSEHSVLAGPEGLQFLYTFAVDRFAEVDYRFATFPPPAAD